MTIEKDRFAHIRSAVANATKRVPAEFKGLVEELKAEKLAEELVVEHGLLEASDEEVRRIYLGTDFRLD